MNIQKNTTQTVSNSGLRDNHRHGKVAAFFEEKTKLNSHIAIVTAYFTVAAYMRMKPVLARGEKIRLLFGDPAFIAGFETVAQNAVFSINDDALALLSKLDQRASVADCIEWFTNDVEVRSVIEPGFLRGKMAHISTPDAAHAIVGSSNFTVRGLGLAQDSNNVELNLIAHDSRDCDALLGWFDELWNDEAKVQDVREAGRCLFKAIL
jgi:PLD-like domain